MPPLGARERAQLPDRAFAYIASDGRRRLPIHDEAHVRNALARFDQVAFDDETARARARTRLLRAAKKHGIVPIGFIDAELRPQRKLPTGTIALLMTDIEGSTRLVRTLGDGYPALLTQTRRLLRAAVRGAGGRVVDARADELFAVFERADAALVAAVDAQRRIRDHEWPDRRDVRVRIGLHRGRPSLTDAGYIGIAVHAGSRICEAAHGGQILLSSAIEAATQDRLPDDVRITSMGTWRMEGIPRPQELFQADAPDLVTGFPPLRRVVAVTAG
jgi:class 3 adenylate cyclase